MLQITNQLIAAEARQRGWQVVPLDEAHSSVLAVTPPGLRTYYIKSCLTNTTAATGYEIAESKFATYIIAERLGIPVADYCLYEQDHPEVADAFFTAQRQAHHQLVVKPVDQNHGDGITVGVTSARSFQRAIRHAQKFSDKIIVQRRHYGTDCRLVTVGDKFIAAAYRMPAFVVGDGTHTIRELVATKNDDPRRAEGHFSPLSTINLTDVEHFIGTKQLDRVPTANEHVTLLGTANLSKGGEAVDITDEIHPSYKQAAVTLAVSLEMGVCGVDFLCDDYTKPLSSDNTILLEINSVPGFRMHHFPSVGTPRNVAAAVIDAFAKHNKIPTYNKG